MYLHVCVFKKVTYALILKMIIFSKRQTFFLTFYNFNIIFLDE